MGVDMTEDTMPPKERDELILQFLENHDVALPPTPLYFNMKRKMTVTFTKKTLRRRLGSMQDRGLLNHIQEGDGYYAITDKGREWLQTQQDG